MSILQRTDNNEDVIDVRDIIERVEELEETSNGPVIDGSAGAEYEGREEDHDVSEWARLAEVDAYAGRRGVDRVTAVNELVNAALSHGLGEL